MASSLKGGGLLLWRAWQSIASLGMVLGIPHTALDNVQGAAGRVLTDAGLWPEPSTVRAVACSRLSSNATVCVEQNCVWCETDRQCHAAASFMDPCTNECCATRARMSTCYYTDPGSIPSACTVPAHNTTAYDEALSLRLLRLAAASYCNVTALQAWQCRPCVDASFRMHTVLRDFDIDLQGFVRVLQSEATGEDEYIAVSFRGTIEFSLQDWISDLTYAQIAAYPEFPKLRVHRGFYRAYNNALREQVLAALAELPPLPIVVTGHSLGAAIAVLCAWDLHVFQQREVAAVYTYGQPRIGNFPFALAYVEHVPNLWRVTHHYDIVPHIPTPQQNFFHSQFEVYYPGDDRDQWAVCDSSGEDPQCSNQCAHYLGCRSISDHLLYMGWPIGSDVC